MVLELGDGVNHLPQRYPVMGSIKGHGDGLQRPLQQMGQITLPILLSLHLRLRLVQHNLEIDEKTDIRRPYRSLFLPMLQDNWLAVDRYNPLTCLLQIQAGNIHQTDSGSRWQQLPPQLEKEGLVQKVHTAQDQQHDN